MSQSTALLRTLLVLGALSPAFARPADPPAPAPAAPAAATEAKGTTPAPAKDKAPEPPLNPGILKEMKSRLFLLKHQAPHSIRDTVRPLGSGVRESLIESVDRSGLATLTVRDFPDNLAAIEQAIQKLDVPPRVNPQVEFHIHILLADRKEGPSEPLVEDLKDVLKALRHALAYKSYIRAASFVQRIQIEGWSHSSGQGVIEWPTPDLKGEKVLVPVAWKVLGLQLSASPEGPGLFSIDTFQVDVDGTSPRSAAIRTRLSLKDGEKTVVGTSTYKDKGLIVVLIARTLR